MSRNFFKRFVGRGVVNFRELFAEIFFDSPFGREGIAYPMLNQILTRLIKKNRRILRPHYTWGVLHSAYLAKTLGLERITAIEFGVAGGNGLIALEQAAIQIEAIFGIGIDVYGFDSGSGLPRPTDYRDMANLFSEGRFSMEIEKLTASLTKAKLVLGFVERTVQEFLASGPTPVGFISFDLDYYSSTKAAFQVLEADYTYLMPRVHCHFDDIIGYTYSEFTGERLAISEFNQSHETRKISPIFGLKYCIPKKYRESLWPEQFYMAHFFDHPLYGQCH
jgi:hypothetical protein